MVMSWERRGRARHGPHVRHWCNGNASLADKGAGFFERLCQTKEEPGSNHTYDNSKFMKIIPHHKWH